MDRRHFIKGTCTACFGATAIMEIFSSCKTSQSATGKLNKDGIAVDVKAFELKEKGKYRSYVVVRNDALLFPICVYRFSEKEYTALWMQCAHQGAELNASGDFLQCPAHGSEFDNKGRVTNGPADRNLRSFPVKVNETEIFIDLRKA
jgi:Rieske Fe-S protein